MNRNHKRNFRMELFIRAGEMMDLLHGLLANLRDYGARLLARRFAPVSNRISYIRLAKAVCAALRDNRDEIGRRVLLPNIVHLFCSPQDREARKSFEDILRAELKEELASRAHEWNQEITSGFFSLELHTDESLHPGECYADCYFDYSRRGEELKEAVNPKATLAEETGIGGKSGAADRTTDAKRSDHIAKSDFQPLIHDDYYRRECRPWAPWKEGRAGCMVKITGPEKSVSHLVPGGRWYIGRGKVCQVILDSDDKKISRRHVEVDVTPDTIRLKCLGLNGALINDREMPPDEWINARPGDALFIGRYELKLSRVKIA